MNPLLQSIQNALNGLGDASLKPTYSATPPDLPENYKKTGEAVTNAARPILGAISAGFDAIDRVAGIPFRVGARAAQLKQGAPKTAEEKVPQRFTEQLGSVTSSFLGEGSRMPAEIAAGFLLPPFGIGGLGKSAVRTAKLSDITTFAEKAALSKSADDIAREAEIAFPGLPASTAKSLGSKYVTETDPLKIVEELRAPLQKTREREIFNTSKTSFPETMKRIEDTRYTVRPTIPTAQAAKNLIRSNPDEAERLALEEFSDQSMFVGEELVKHFDELAAESRRVGDILSENMYLDKSANILNTVARNATEAGRIAQATSMLTRMTPDGIARFAAKEIQRYNEKVAPGRRIPELSGPQAKELKEEWKRIQAIENADEKAIAIKKYYDNLSALVPSDWWKKIATVWKAGLLTGLRTTGLNVLSTTANSVGEVIKDIPAAAVDSVYSLFSGKRTLAITARGLAGGGKEGFEKGWRYLRTGYNERDVMSKFDVKRVNFGNSPFAKSIQRYEEAIFRWIGSQDMPFYYGAKARSLHGQAIAQGKNLGLKGKELDKYVDELVQDPTDDMLKYAAMDAEIATFQNSTALGKLGQSLQYKGGEFIVPFARTPAAVAMQVINYTPMGMVGEIIEPIGPPIPPV